RVNVQFQKFAENLLDDYIFPSQPRNPSSPSTTITISHELPPTFPHCLCSLPPHPPLLLSRLCILSHIPRQPPLHLQIPLQNVFLRHRHIFFILPITPARRMHRRDSPSLCREQRHRDRDLLDQYHRHHQPLTRLSSHLLGGHQVSLRQTTYGYCPHPRSWSRGRVHRDRPPHAYPPAPLFTHRHAHQDFAAPPGVTRRMLAVPHGAAAVPRPRTPARTTSCARSTRRRHWHIPERFAPDGSRRVSCLTLSSVGEERRGHYPLYLSIKFACNPVVLLHRVSSVTIYCSPLV
ncbi:hypothetical protein OF83DRAFT_221410, partial [Amylostereum chailletii]